MSQTKFLAILTITFLMFGCFRWHTFETTMVERINELCKAPDSCKIQARDFTDFTWEKMYVFKYNATEDDVFSALGTRLPVYTEFTRKIVFLSDKKVIRSEELPTNIERVENRQVVFDIPDSKTYKGYIPDTVFQVERKPLQDGFYYKLTEVK